MVVKVKDGTRDNSNLCTTCAFSVVIKGSADSEVATRCTVMDYKEVPFRVVECNKYINKAEPSIYDMREIAWVLSTDKQKKYGFRSPKEWKKDREEINLDDLPNKPPRRFL